MIEAAFGEFRQGYVQVRVFGHNDRRYTSVLQCAARSRRKLRAQFPADGRAADEAQEPDPPIGDEARRDFAAVGQQRLTPRIGESRLTQDADKAEARQRRNGRRLDDHRAACRNRRCNLVHDQIQRMIERTDSNYDADRLALRERDPVRRRGIKIHRDHMTGVRAQQLGAIQHAVDGTRDFDARVDQRLATLARGFERERLGTLFHQLRGLGQDGDPLRRREPRSAIAKQLVGSRECLLDDFRAADVDAADQLLVKRSVDFEWCGAWRCTGNE